MWNKNCGFRDKGVKQRVWNQYFIWNPRERKILVWQFQHLAACCEYMICVQVSYIGVWPLTSWGRVHLTWPALKCLPPNSLRSTESCWHIPVHLLKLYSRKLCVCVCKSCFWKGAQQKPQWPQCSKIAHLELIHVLFVVLPAPSIKCRVNRHMQTYVKPVYVFII